MAKQINAYIDEGLHGAIAAQAQAENRSTSNLVEKALYAYIASPDAEAARDVAAMREAALVAFGEG